MFDVAIVGAGPAGQTALLYANLYSLDAVCIGDEIGGKLRLAPEIIDYPGVEKISGKEFVTHLQTKINDVHASIIVDEITSIISKNSLESGSYFSIQTKSSKMFLVQSVIFATGNGKKQKVNRGADLARSIGVILDDGLFVTDFLGKTNINRIFAAGDCLTYPRSMEQLSTAVSSAIVAVGGVYELLKKTRPPILWGEAKIGRR